MWIKNTSANNKRNRKDAGYKDNNNNDKSIESIRVLLSLFLSCCPLLCGPDSNDLDIKGRGTEN